MRKGPKIAACLAGLLLLQHANAIQRQANTDYRARREKLAKALDGGTALLFASTEAAGSEALHGYLPDKNFYYLTGWIEPGAAVLISPATPALDDEPARPYREVLYLPPRRARLEKWTGEKAGPETKGIRQRSGFDEVASLDRLKDDLVATLPSRRQAVYTDVPTIGQSSPSASGIEWLQRSNAFIDASFRNVNDLIGDLRRFKDAGEMEIIRHATDASMAAHRVALKSLDGGMTERALAGLMQYQVMKDGCERMAYAPIVGGGLNGATLHYADLTGTLQNGDLVVIDVAGEYSLYASDITRTAPVNGHFTPRQRELYDIVLGAQRAAAAAVKEGVSTFSRTGQNSIYTVAFDYINTHGKDLHGQPLGKYFTHGISHYIGLDVHDPGTPVTIQPGMVFSIEPGIYIPEEGIGIRIEDVYWMDPAGKLVDLTEQLPHTADQIEAAMRR